MFRIWLAIVEKFIRTYPTSDKSWQNGKNVGV
jgi:hypothetical protein